MFIKDIDLSKYKDSMSPLIKRDVEELLKIIGEQGKQLRELKKNNP